MISETNLPRISSKYDKNLFFLTCKCEIKLIHIFDKLTRDYLYDSTEFYS